MYFIMKQNLNTTKRSSPFSPLFFTR